MSVIDVEVPAPTATDGAFRCRQSLRHAIDGCEHACEKVRRMVQKYGRSEIAAALGSDAAGLQALYGQLKTLVETYGRDVPDLPAG